MADYPTRYLFIAETQGITKAATELASLQRAMAGVNRGASINLSKEQQAQSNAAAAVARANQALANSQNAASRALRDDLAAAGADVDWVEFPGGHEIPPPVLAGLGRLIARVAAGV